MAKKKPAPDAAAEGTPAKRLSLNEQRKFTRNVRRTTKRRDIK